ncbi:hypothetical protein E2C01_079935 [Portunus trituberculatus]|uniref:Uncharacterized protein n=1 Tax=Portunus trituberculatus TaxID=210409 RepID=A0A5B7IMS7_PORTR|nr:hypothetical protein [Portunus trituberculatus]
MGRSRPGGGSPGGVEQHKSRVTCVAHVGAMSAMGCTSSQSQISTVQSSYGQITTAKSPMPKYSNSQCPSGEQLPCSLGEYFTSEYYDGNSSSSSS